VYSTKSTASNDEIFAAAGVSHCRRETVEGGVVDDAGKCRRCAREKEEDAFCDGGGEGNNLAVSHPLHLEALPLPPFASPTGWLRGSRSRRRRQLTLVASLCRGNMKPQRIFSFPGRS